MSSTFGQNNLICSFKLYIHNMYTKSSQTMGKGIFNFYEKSKGIPKLGGKLELMVNY